MYLAEYEDPQLGSWLSKVVKKVTKPITSVAKAIAKPVLQVVKSVDKVALKITPKVLRPVVSRVQASGQRALEAVLVPTEAPRLVKEEFRQMKDAVKDPAFMSIVGKLMAAAAILYPPLKLASGAMSLLEVAAQRTAAKQQMAKDQAEVDAAQREFDAYAKQLADLQAQSVTLQQSQAAAVASTPAAAPVAVPLTTQSAVLTAPAGASATSFREVAQASPAQAGAGLPAWLGPTAIAAAALFSIPILMPNKTPARTRRRRR